MLNIDLCECERCWEYMEHWTYNRKDPICIKCSRELKEDQENDI